MSNEPSAFDPDFKDFYSAFKGGAYGPFPIDAEDEGPFLERWLRLLAKAALGELRRPDKFPLTQDALE
jgi:hypothetical protein